MDDVVRVNAKRLLCPLPVIRTQDCIKALSRGDQVEVSCTDRGALHDIPTWCRLNGHRVSAIEEDGFDITIRIEVGGGSDA